jgi:hypothetical protein
MSARPDYIVATTLPFMQLVHHDPNDRVRDFTVDEARQLYMDGLPLLINHNDGETIGADGEPRPLLEIGRIEASTTSTMDASILATIDPSLSQEATFASNAVATGIYPSVSLGHDIATVVHASGGGLVRYQKTPKEVSVCRRGRRYGSDITAYCPGRGTLERLAKHAPDDLETMIERHGYRAGLIESGLAASDGARYISRLAELSDNRLASVIAQQGLRPRLPSTMSVAASDDMNADIDTTAAAPPSTVATPAAAPAAAAVPPTAAAPPPPPKAASPTPPPSRTIETSAVGGQKYGGRTVEEWADDARLASESSLARTKELAAERAEKEAMRAELEKAREAAARLAAIEEKQAKKARSDFEQIVKSYIQHAKEARTPDAEIDATVEAAATLHEAQPDASLDMLRMASRMAIRAADNANASEKMLAQTMADATSSYNEGFFQKTAKQLSAMREAEVALMRSSYTTPLSQRFQSPSQPTPPATPSVAPSAAARASLPRAADAAPPVAAAAVQTTKRAYAEYVEKPASGHFTVQAADDDKDTYPVAEIATDIMKMTNKYASMSQLQYGEYYEATGRMQAGPNGDEPEIVTKRLRKTPARITPWNFAPRFGAALDKAQAQLAGLPRGSSKFELKMVERGPEF